MQLLVQMRCQSKGQISAAILTSNNSLCLYENRRYITENTEEWIAPSANVNFNPFLLEFYGSVDYQEVSYVSSFSFVIVYLVVGGLTKTLTVPAVLIVSFICLTSFESEESQLSRDI